MVMAGIELIVGIVVDTSGALRAGTGAAGARPGGHVVIRAGPVWQGRTPGGGAQRLLITSL